MSLFPQNWSFNSAHLCLSLTTGSLHLRTLKPLKTHHSALKKKEKEGLLPYISKADRFHKTPYFLSHTLSIKTVFAPCFCNSSVWQTLQEAEVRWITEVSQCFSRDHFLWRQRGGQHTRGCCLHSWTQLSTDPLCFTIKVKFTSENSYSKMQLTNFYATNITQVIHIHFW